MPRMSTQLLQRRRWAMPGCKTSFLFLLALKVTYFASFHIYPLVRICMYSQARWKTPSRKVASTVYICIPVNAVADHALLIPGTSESQSADGSVKTSRKELSKALSDLMKAREMKACSSVMAISAGHFIFVKLIASTTGRHNSSCCHAPVSFHVFLHHFVVLRLIDCTAGCQEGCHCGRLPVQRRAVARSPQPACGSAAGNSKY